MKILICDDEGIVQESLRFIITKNFGEDFEIEGAKSGRIAIEKARELRPDLIFMDIQMPGINGIEAMAEIRRDDKKVKFIVLTAYDKFEYAKKAIDIGVLEYLTKPINKDKVVEVLRLAIKEIDNDRKKISRELEIKEKLESVIPVIENGFIYNIVLQEGEGLTDYISLLNLSSEYGFMAVIECGDEMKDGKLTNTLGAGVRLQKHLMVFRETIKESFGAIIGNLMGNRVLVFVPTKSEEDEYDNRIRTIESMRAMVRKLGTELNMKFKVGIGRITRLDSMPISYQEALTAVRQGGSRVNHIKDLVLTTQREAGYPKEVEDEIFHAVKEGNKEVALEQSNIFISWIFSQGEEINNTMRLKLLEHAMSVETIASFAGAYYYRFSDRDSYLDTVMSFNTKEELGAWFLHIVADMSERVKKKQSEKSDSIVESAKEYIRKNFSKEVSLNEISKEVNISPYYFSKIFKETEGKTYIDYLTGLRIDYAKNELKNSDKSIKEICKEAGYNDPNYFSRIFKKMVGLTPSEYKES